MPKMQPRGRNDAKTLQLNKKAVRRVLKAFNNNQPELIDSVTHPSIIDHSPAPGLPPGLEGMKRQIRNLHRGFPDVHFEEEMLVAEKDMVILRWRMMGHWRAQYFFAAQPTGKEVVHYGHEIVRLKEGKIIEHRDTADPLMFMDKLGALNATTMEEMTKFGLRHYDIEPFR